MLKRCEIFFFPPGNSFYCFLALYCFSCLTVKPPLTAAEAQIYVQLGVYGAKGRGPGGWSCEEYCLVFPALWASHTSRGLRLVQDSGQHSRTLRKGYPSNREAGHLHQCLQEEKAWVSHYFIQNPLPNLAIVGIKWRLKPSPNSATCFLEALDKSLGLSWLQLPHL